jgi:hypothetical protein
MPSSGGVVEEFQEEFPVDNREVPLAVLSLQLESLGLLRVCAGDRNGYASQAYQGAADSPRN